MRCSRCGKRIKKKSAFCPKCGAKVPPAPKKVKKKKDKKERSKAKIAIPVFILLILAILSFLIFGGDRVPEKIRDIKGYSYLTGMIKEKLPEELPFDLPKPSDVSIKLPFDISFKLPFDLPDPGDLFGGGKLPDKKKITKDLAAYKGDKGSKIKFDSLKIEKRTTAEKEKKETVFVATTKKGEDSAGYYKLVYKRQLIGGWKLKEVKPYNKEEQEAAAAEAGADGKNAMDAGVSKKNVTDSGVKNKAVLGDPAVLSDIPSDWKQSNLKVIDHYTDLKAGTDTVVVYMELENSYVNMTGTKEVTYKYNEKTKKWEADSVSKLTCQTIEPVKPAETPQ